MIEIEKKIIVYSYLITEIYCCDCFFDRIMTLIDNSRKFTEPNEFIEILEKEFDSKKYLLILFGGKVLLICKKLLDFIIKIKKEDEKIMLSHCVTDFISDGDQVLEICAVCFIKIVEKNRLLKHFQPKKKVRDETYYIYL